MNHKAKSSIQTRTVSALNTTTPALPLSTGSEAQFYSNKQYLKSVEHEAAAGEDTSLDDIIMAPDLEEEEDVEINEEEEVFMLPDGVELNRKVLSAVGEKVRGYKFSLRCKYVKEDTTKEALYHLDITKHQSNISDQMWVGLVDYFFLDKFQIVLLASGSSEVEFSEATIPTETYAYRKLMGPESGDRIRGVGNGVAPSKFCSKFGFQSGIRTSKSSMISMLLKEVKSLHQENGHFEEDNTLNSSLHGGGKENVQMHEQRDIEVIMSDIGSLKDANTNTSTSHDQIKQSNPLHGLNISSKSQMGKGHVAVLTELENSMALGDERVRANMNATSTAVNQAYNNI
ncbi:hypothetical protein Cgig2_006617 [Carnegiea gigantea]|uniref:Uncharacterized protein n=1 Tax=Carnegiea gigantea TaxID=171969 RepID=A0A9Q1KNW1_9CARY|nr:hypothetical protein Cgig2_006617 [Carnegiea gigantea]